MTRTEHGQPTDKKEPNAAPIDILRAEDALRIKRMKDAQQKAESVLSSHPSHSADKSITLPFSSSDSSSSPAPGKAPSQLDYCDYITAFWRPEATEQQQVAPENKLRNLSSASLNHQLASCFILPEREPSHKTMLCFQMIRHVQEENPGLLSGPLYFPPFGE
jgi:hypothetical protein